MIVLYGFVVVETLWTIMAVPARKKRDAASGFPHDDQDDLSYISAMPSYVHSTDRRTVGQRQRKRELLDSSCHCHVNYTLNKAHTDC